MVDMLLHWLAWLCAKLLIIVPDSDLLAAPVQKLLKST